MSTSDKATAVLYYLLMAVGVFLCLYTFVWVPITGLVADLLEQRRNR